MAELLPALLQGVARCMARVGVRVARPRVAGAVHRAPSVGATTAVARAARRSVGMGARPRRRRPGGRARTAARPPPRPPSPLSSARRRRASARWRGRAPTATLTRSCSLVAGRSVGVRRRRCSVRLPIGSRRARVGAPPRRRLRRARLHRLRPRRRRQGENPMAGATPRRRAAGWRSARTSPARCCGCSGGSSERRARAAVRRTTRCAAGAERARQPSQPPAAVAMLAAAGAATEEELGRWEAQVQVE